MTDNRFFVENSPKRHREIGRVNNESHPDPNRERTPVRPEIGRINNDLDPVLERSPSEEEIGRVNNELDPSAVPAQPEIGRVNNEQK